jgi:hypothetical protein
MGLMRMIAGAAVVGGIVWYGESGSGNPAPAIATATQTAREAVVFCQTYPALCRKAGETARERIVGGLAEGKDAASPRGSRRTLDDN